MTGPIMQRAALSGWQGASGYPNALTTGPAAGGYSPNTAVTISTGITLINGSNPAWVSTVGTTLLIEDVAFTLTGGNITVTATAATFAGCTFTSQLLATTSAPVAVIVHGAGPYVFSYCTMGAADGTGMTRVSEMIDQYEDCVLTVDHCEVYWMRQAVNMASGISSGVTITNNYFHDCLMYPLVAPGPIITTTASGGSIAAGTYGACITYASSGGESLPSSVTSVVTTGTASTIVIDSPATSPSQTNWFAYVSQAGGASYYKQQASGSPTAIGTNYTLTTTPSTTGTSTLPDSDHTEPVFAGAVNGGSNITITGNTLLNGINQTAAILLGATQAFTNVTIANNFLAGGGYTLYCGYSTSTNVVVQNNVFSTTYFTKGGFDGTGYPTHPPPFNSSGGNVWTANTWFDGAVAGNTVNPP